MSAAQRARRRGKEEVDCMMWACLDTNRLCGPRVVLLPELCTTVNQDQHFGTPAARRAFFGVVVLRTSDDVQEFFIFPYRACRL